MKCRSCFSENLSDILDLGMQPWCGNFLTKEQLGKEEYYPLKLVFCEDCELLQLDHTVPKEVMFSEHDYLSGTTKTLRRHFLELAIENKGQLNLSNSDLIVDIGGNDGTG